MADLPAKRCPVMLLPPVIAAPFAGGRVPNRYIRQIGTRDKV
jgi:hypothetical protein